MIDLGGGAEDPKLAARLPMSSHADPRARIREFLTSTFLLSDGEFPYADDASLMAEGVIDSTGVLELILFLEEAFGVQVADAEATPKNLDSVASIAEFVARKRAASPSDAVR